MLLINSDSNQSRLEKLFNGMSLCGGQHEKDMCEEIIFAYAYGAIMMTAEAIAELKIIREELRSVATKPFL